VHINAAAIFYLVYTELQFNLSPTVIDRVHVNATSPTGLEVEFDISFPNIGCALLSLDAADPTGQAQSFHLDHKHHVWKHRLDKNGNLIGHRSKFEMGATMRDEAKLRELVKQERSYLIPEGGDNGLLMANNANVSDTLPVKEGGEDDDMECGTCYGAGDEGECCNSCDDVKRAYRRKGWLIPNLAEVRICNTQVKSADETNEGCNVHGIVALSTGGGNFHIAPGHSLEQFGNEAKLTFVDIIVGAFETFNASHTIHKLHFGNDFPGNTYQLDGQDRFVDDNFIMHQYYIQVVPTLYKFLNGTSIQTNQFSVTEHKRHVHPGSNRGLPGVYFFYELSPLHVEFEEYRLGLIRFFTSVCAVVGGVFTVMGALDKYIYHSSNPRGKRSSLG
jgi:hypothetical protein